MADENTKKRHAYMKKLNYKTIVIILVALIVVMAGYYLWTESQIKSKSLLMMREAFLYSSESAKSNDRISGILENKSNREFSNITIKFAIFEASGNETGYQIGVQEVHIEDILPHKSFKFDEPLDEKFNGKRPTFCVPIKITLR